MAVPVRETPSITTGTPVALFEFRPGGALITPYYSVAADGQRFLLSTIAENSSAAPLSVLVNWHGALQGSSSRVER